MIRNLFGSDYETKVRKNSIAGVTKQLSLGVETVDLLISGSLSLIQK